MYEEETGSSVFTSLKEAVEITPLPDGLQGVNPFHLPDTWEELDEERQALFVGFADHLNAYRFLNEAHKAVETVPGLGDEVEPFGLAYRGRVIGLGMDKPDRPEQVNNLAVCFVSGTTGSLPHEYLTRVMSPPQEEEEGVA